MRRLRAASFSFRWKELLGWKAGSRVAVLLEDRWEWDRLPEQFRESFLWHFQVFFLEIETGGIWQEREKQREAVAELARLRPQALLGVGSFGLLQRVILFREMLGSGEIPVLLLSGRDRWQFLFRPVLWIRGDDGQTQYWGYVQGHELDAVVMMEAGAFCDGTPDVFDRELYRFQRVLQIIGRNLCHELAEPLRVVYGIPMEIGSYFSILYLYRILSPQEQEKICGLLGSGACRPDWRLEEMAETYRGEEMAGILLSEQDVPLLTQMAMEGIENAPAGQQLAWGQVELFYREWCE